MATRTKSRKPKADTTPRPKPTPNPKPAKKKPPSPKFCSVKVVLHHPFQKVSIPVDLPGVQLERDGWLDSQINAGLIREL